MNDDFRHDEIRRKEEELARMKDERARDIHQQYIDQVNYYNNTEIHGYWRRESERERDKK